MYNNTNLIYPFGVKRENSELVRKFYFTFNPEGVSASLILKPTGGRIRYFSGNVIFKSQCNNYKDCILEGIYKKGLLRTF
jgi:hypothetical protein